MLEVLGERVTAPVQILMVFAVVGPRADRVMIFSISHARLHHGEMLGVRLFVKQSILRSL